MTKVFVFGLDGATFDLILPWAKQGKLPYFRRLLAEGSWGELESAPNMRSPAAWTSFMTGKNPGKHGLFEFYEPIPNTYDVRFVQGGMRRGKSLWAILSEWGKRVGVINVPMTYPAEKVNGFVLAGLDAPGPESPGFCYPAGLLQELQSRFGKYILEPGLTGCIVDGKPDLAIDKLQVEMNQKDEITTYLMQKFKWDFFMVVFRSLDAVQHCFWRYMDPTHPQHNLEEADSYGQVILQAYKQIDDILGAIWKALDNDTVLIVMSDHGFGRKHPANNQLNLWLASQGFLRFLNDRAPKMTPKKEFTNLLENAYRLLIGKTPRSFKEKLARRFPQLRNQVQSRLCFSNIDWSCTKAYSDTLFPNIRINLEGREPRGIVKNEEYWQVVEVVRKALSECKDTLSGRRIVDAVLHRDELYSGPFVEKAPDLLIRWKEDEEIRGLSLGDVTKPSPSMMKYARPLIPGEDPNIISGDHRMYGVLLMVGKPIRQRVQLSQARLVDLAPTILQLLNIPVPSDMDGCVLAEAIRDEAILASTKRSIDEIPYATSLDTEKDFSAEEKEAIAERLRDLGYLE